MSYFIAPSGIRWSYELKGEGEPIIFLHGWGCSKSVWKQQLEYFSGTHMVLALDLPGHGESSWLAISFKEMAEDLNGMLEELDFKSVNVVANSLGGFLAIEFAYCYPQKVKRLVMAGCLPKFARCADYPHGLPIERIKTLGQQLKDNYPSIVHIFFRSLFTAHERQGERYQWLQQFGPKEDVPRQEALQEFLTMLEQEDLREIFKEIRIPIQFMNGEEDYICSQQAAEAFHKCLLGSRLEIFRRCGHFPFLTNPKKFNRILEEFLIAT